MKRAAFVLTLAATLSAHAQTPVNEADPAMWMPMKKAVFDWPEVPSTVNDEERGILQKLWANELAARHRHASGYLPGFALIGDVREGAKRIVFSMFSAGGVASCDPAANGAAAHDIYEVCHLRVASWPVLPGSAPLVVDLPGYCMIAGSSNSKGWTEYRYDKPAQTVQFRTIQFGKVVPNCSRSLKLG